MEVALEYDSHELYACGAGETAGGRWRSNRRQETLAGYGFVLPAFWLCCYF